MLWDYHNKQKDFPVITECPVQGPSQLPQRAERKWGKVKGRKKA